MASEPGYEGFGSEMMGEGPRRSRMSSCLMGCLIVMGIGLVLAIVVGFWVSRNWRDWVADFSTGAIQQGIDAWDLPEQEKQEVRAQVDRVVDAFREGRLSGEQLALIMQKLVDSPLMTTITVAVAERAYLDKSGLTDEEKADGRQALKRFVRGVVDKKIDKGSSDAVMAHIADREPNGEWQFRKQVSDADLKAFLAAAQAEADKAEIPAEPEDIDPSAELKRIVDEALNEAETPAEGAPAADGGGDGS